MKNYFWCLLFVLLISGCSEDRIFEQQTQPVEIQHIIGSRDAQYGISMIEWCSNENIKYYITIYRDRTATPIHAINVDGTYVTCIPKNVNQ